MTEQWIKDRRATLAAEAQAERDRIMAELDKISTTTYDGTEITQEIKQAAKQFLTDIFDRKSYKITSEDLTCEELYCNCGALVAVRQWCKQNKKDDKWLDMVDCVEQLKVDQCLSILHKSEYLDTYLDSTPMEFDGSLLITDPCYIERSGTEDWEKCNCGYAMEALGITHYMTRDTIYGDWSCTVFNTDTETPIGQFCADAGLVSVFLLDEVLKYNPTYDDFKAKPYVATVIPDFKGTVQFVVEHDEGVYEEDTTWCKAGEKWEDFSVCVVGHGVNKVTGEPINFRSGQTGF